MVRVHVIFTGSVQGVGFRYTARAYASTLRVTGWVKNLSDGRVEMVAQGTREQLENLLYKIEKEFTITHKDIDWLPARNDFKAFEVTY